MRRIGEAIGAGRQQARQQTGPEQIAGFSIGVFEAEHDLRDPAIGGGKGEASSGLGGKTVGDGELPGLRGKAGANRLPRRLGRKGNGNG